MPFFKWTEMESDFITPGYSKGTGPTVKGVKIEVALMNYPAGTFGGTALMVTDGSNLSIGTGATGNNSRLYVSRGVGTTFTPIRLNAPPEINLFNLI